MRTRSPSATNAALQNVAHAKLAADLAHVDRLALVLEGGIAGDDEQLGEPRQLGKDILGNAVGEIVLALVAAEVVERQHGDRRPVGQGQGGSWLLGPGGCARRRSRTVVAPRAPRPRSAAPCAGKVLISRWVSPLSPMAVRAALMRVNRAVSETMRPSQTASDEVILADDPLAVLDQVRQQVEDLGLDRYRGIAAAQLARSVSST